MNISLPSVVGKFYAGLLVSRVLRGTKDLIDDEKENFKPRRRCSDEIIEKKRQRERGIRECINVL